MIKIGDFARLAQVSIATLRHYDEIGLLKPASIDRSSGYRFYSAGQLPRLNRILALKDLGFSLEQIGYALDDGVTPAQLHGMLKLKRAEIEARLAEEHARLHRIEARIRLIEVEDTMPDYEIILKQTAPLRVASQRVNIPTNDQVPVLLGVAFTEVYEYSKANGAKDMGPCLTIWHSPADQFTDEVAEAMVPIDRPLPGNDRVQVYELPGVQVAALIHHGDFADFTQGHVALMQWIEANGYRICGPYREIYIQHEAGNLSESTTEIQFPVEK